MDLDIKFRDEKFLDALFNRRNLFPFSIARMPDKSNHSANGAESVKIVIASNYPELLSASIKSFVTRMSR